MKILIVDDSRAIRFFVQKSLSMVGINESEIKLAEDGAEGIKILEAGGIDILFLDINLPKLNGLGVVERMFKSGDMEKTKVVIISSIDNKEKLEFLKSHGVKHFLRKPFTPEKLTELFLKLQGETKQ